MKLLTIAPTPEEFKILTEYKGEKNTISSAEQFMTELCKVPMLDARLNCLVIKMRFSSQFILFNKNFENVKKAKEAIKNNEELKEVIVTILKIGNYLNYGTNKGKQVSFKMDLLSRLS